MRKRERVALYRKIYEEYADRMWIHCGDCGEDKRAFSYIKVREVVVPPGVFEDPSEWDIITLLHEIGHIMTNKMQMRVFEKEYLATQWSADEAKRWGFQVKDLYRKAYQDYVWDKRRLCLNYGGKNVPAEKELVIHW